MATIQALYADRIVETTTTTGTGTITLGGAFVGSFGKCQTFSGNIADGTRVDYTIFNDTDEEVGTGVYSAGTLTRDVVFQSSNGGINGSLVNLNAAVHVVFINQPAQSVADIGATSAFMRALVNQ